MAKAIGKGRVGGGGIPQKRIPMSNPANQAISNLGRALKGTANLAEQLQGEQERQWMGAAEIDMNKSSGELQVKLARAANPEEHLRIAKLHFQGAKASILNREGYSKKFRDELADRINLYESRQIEKIATDAKLMQISNGRKIHNERVRFRLEDGDTEGAKALLNEGKGTYYTDGIGDLRIEEIDRQERIESWNGEVNAGNAEFFDNEDLPMSETDRVRFKTRAENAKSRNESKEVGQISGAVAIGEIQTEEDLVRYLEGTTSISPQTSKKILKNWRDNKPITFKEKKKTLDKINGLYEQFSKGKIDKEAYEKGYHDLVTEVSAIGRRDVTGDLGRRLGAVSPESLEKTGGKAPGKVEGDRFVEQLSSRWATAGGFGKPRKGESALSPMDALDAEIAQELAEAAVKEWLRTDEGKGATQDQIKKRFIKEAVESMTDVSIDGGEQSDEDYYNGAIEGRTMLPPIGE